jgi:hypothetical protein
MSVGKGYRIPKLEEFVQGFEFEVKNSCRYAIIDLSTGESSFGEPQHFWTEGKVWWMKESKWISVFDEDSGVTITYNQAGDNFFKPFDEKSFIEQGLVRVKIKEDEQ